MDQDRSNHYMRQIGKALLKNRDKRIPFPEVISALHRVMVSLLACLPDGMRQVVTRELAEELPELVEKARAAGTNVPVSGVIDRRH